MQELRQELSFLNVLKQFKSKLYRVIWERRENKQHEKLTIILNADEDDAVALSDKLSSSGWKLVHLEISVVAREICVRLKFVR